MMERVIRVDDTQANALQGRPVVSFSKTLWTGGMLAAALALVPSQSTWPAIITGLVLTYATLLIGHSVGMHRMMIHRAFRAPIVCERLLIWIGVLVGIGGPKQIIEIHDTRDWAQRQKNCHPFFSHKKGFVRDIIWQLFYVFDFERPPKLTVEPRLRDDPWIQFFNHTWRWHQVGLAVILFIVGGWPYVVWGIFVRIPLSTIGHWTVTYICHNPGPGRWTVRGAGVQASDLVQSKRLRGIAAGLLTHGECWHSNHHAFPESAQIGLYKGQVDPAWFIISILEKCGLAKSVGRPRAQHFQDDLIEANAL